MHPLYLLDPWFVQINRDDAPETVQSRYRALQRINDLHRTYCMRRVKFITWGQLDEFFRRNARSQRPDYREIYQIAKSVLLDGGTAGPSAVIVDAPCPTLSAEWLHALATHGADESAPNWRWPAVIISAERSTSWPSHTERKRRELKYSIVGRADPTVRNLVCIELYDEHAFFEPDLDPWRLGAAGAPLQNVSGAVRERRGTLQKLPRPPKEILPLRLTFTEICQRLQDRIDWTCGRQDEVFFVPPIGWDPRTITRENWRERKIFETSTTADGHRGPVDREGRIWLWDPEENHWDVQLSGGDYRRVSHNGRLL